MREFSVDNVLALVRALFGLKKASSPLLARIKHMHRLGFPTGHFVGRGHRTSYDAEKLVQLCLAFAFIDAGLTSAHAAEIVDRHWSLIRKGMSVAAGGTQCDLIVSTGSLRELGAPPGDGRKLDTAASLHQIDLPPGAHAHRFTRVVLDLVAFLDALQREVGNTIGIDEVEWSATMEEIASGTELRS